MSDAVQLRCPGQHRRMFGKLLAKEKPKITSDNLMEFACEDCRKELRVRQVFHRFNVAGELVETEVVDR